ncbi:cytochrome P450 2C27-like [Tachyglossus aculeatus]|uniref:cytochrome P450 2C27-like n=1 Tax=Tachyglossus aculeatus TaxID=9261 RepID=UPI0018F7914A|nr:cytochrome P450 2C27-like [Tachyglossus aculeatus]
MAAVGTTGLLLAACVCLLCFLLTRGRRRGARKLPPGPFPLPFLGNLLQMDTKDLANSIQALRARYGPVFSVHFGKERAVMVFGYEAVREVLLERGDEFLARGSFPTLDRTNRGLGIVMSKGERWRNLRRFSLSVLRDLGMGKRGLEERVQDEAQCLLEEFRKTQGQPFDPKFLLGRATANVICQVVFGQRFPYTDDNFNTLMRLLNESTELHSSLSGQIYNLIPSVMDYLPGPHQRIFSNTRHIQDFVASWVDKHRETLEPSAPQDYIDSFLLKMQQEQQQPDSEFTLENLKICVQDLFVAGTETVTITLCYALLILLKYPAVADKICEEIHRVIGQERAPAIKDRALMPYTDATIHEIQRHLNLLPIGLPRATVRDTLFHGFVIPKGTTVYPGLGSVLNDSQQFPEPECFAPEHFLDSKGAFKKSGAFVVFSAGKRNCIGESIAHVELFLFLTTLLQSLRLSRPPGVQAVDVQPGIRGVANLPRPFQICVTPH